MASIKLCLFCQRPAIPRPHDIVVPTTRALLGARVYVCLSDWPLSLREATEMLQLQVESFDQLGQALQDLHDRGVDWWGVRNLADTREVLR